MWRRKRGRRTTVTKHYLKHKEQARIFIHARISHWNRFYQCGINRIAIRNQRSCWGSCSENKNLNFSYRLLFLPPHLVDYVVVHELCHLKEFNHSKAFWKLVEQTQPDYKKLRKELTNTTRVSYSYLNK